MKFLLVIQLLLSSAFAHGSSEPHIHFFSFLHVENFVMVIAVLILGFSLFKYFIKEVN
jgi:hypothetical protein